MARDLDQPIARDLDQPIARNAATEAADGGPPRSPLEREIRRRIGLAGPMPVQQFMALCLSHPEHGYYVTRDPLGAGGDFITSPEVSQVFGELLGLWAASTWQLMGHPENIRLIELGPGRGTMMLDALRAAQVVPAFRAAIVVHLVEVSPVLRERQQRTLGNLDTPMMWHDTVDDIPDGPAIVLANEFVDALPVSQAVKQFNGWSERVVEIDRDGHLAFGIADNMIPGFERLLPPAARDAPVGSIFEWRTDDLPLALARRIVRQGGAALIVDYGHAESSVGETLQALRGHAFANPLLSPGELDLTAHVDFQAFAIAAESMGARAHGPIDQARLLRSLGIEARAAALQANASRKEAADIDAAVKRLLGEASTDMGKMFKALAITDHSLGELPGFEASPW